MQRDKLIEIDYLEEYLLGYMDFLCDKMALINRRYYEVITESNLFIQFNSLINSGVRRRRYFMKAYKNELASVTKYLVYRYKNGNRQRVREAFISSILDNKVEMAKLFVDLGNNINKPVKLEMGRASFLFFKLGLDKRFGLMKWLINFNKNKNIIVPEISMKISYVRKQYFLFVICENDFESATYEITL